MNNLITPKTIDTVVTSFCSSISTDHPFYVDIKIEEYSRPLFCFENVDEKLNRDDGTKVLGWQIWLWPDIFIEAEFHAVWKSDAGNYIDITPKHSGESKILFLPDSKAKKTNSLIKNIRHALSDNGLIKHYFSIFDAMLAIREVAGERIYQNQVSLQEEEAKFFNWLQFCQEYFQRMLQDGLSLNSRCPCNSGLKVKNCCADVIGVEIEKLRKQYKF